VSDQPAPVTVVVTTDGPYVVTGPVAVDFQVIAEDDTGASWTWKRGAEVPTGRKFSLCRCGHSQNKPFCDDSHLTAGFDGTETASRAAHADQAETIDGPTMSLADVGGLCTIARFCDGHGDAWSAVAGSSTDDARGIASHETSHCPGGRLVVRDRNAAGAELEPELAPSIGVIEDPASQVSGGLWLRGGITVTSEDGTPYPVRNRVVLCRCGASENKPFCDGSHLSTGFADAQLATYDATPDGSDSVSTPAV
jgi:CDGSH-type Zn-finger protein